MGEQEAVDIISKKHLESAVHFPILINQVRSRTFVQVLRHIQDALICSSCHGDYGSTAISNYSALSSVLQKYLLFNISVSCYLHCITDYFE